MVSQGLCVFIKVKKGRHLGEGSGCTPRKSSEKREFSPKRKGFSRQQTMGTDGIEFKKVILLGHRTIE